MPRIFVFGSNRQGRHGKGAALAALNLHGAVYGQPEGPQGNSYAIVTKELRSNYPPVTLPEVIRGILRFRRYALDNPELEFEVTKVGCGLAGFSEAEIAPYFSGLPDRIHLPKGWTNGR
jgi:hypothetical protein